LSEEQCLIQESARAFAREQLPALADRLEEEDCSVPDEWQRRYAEMGFLGVNVPTQYGGQGAGALEAVLVLEEFARVSSAVAMPVFEASFGPMAVLVHFAPEHLKRRLLPLVCSGELVIAVSMSEPNAGTALTDLTTHATTRGSSLILNGTKRWCSGAGHAGGYLVYCRLAPVPGAAGIGAVYVARDTPGLSFGKREQLMGFRGIMTADMYFDDAEVPAENLVVPAGGFRKLMEAFDLERCGNTTMSLGIAAGALETAVRYVQERQQFGKALVEFQAVQIKLAEMALRVDAARLLLYRAVCNAHDGLPGILESSMAKCFANEMVREVTGSALQLLGGYGYSKENDIERRLRDAWGWGIAGGTIDVQKTNICAALVGRRFDQRR